jgi:hypothetical protein
MIFPTEIKFFFFSLIRIKSRTRVLFSLAFDDTNVEIEIGNDEKKQKQIVNANEPNVNGQFAVDQRPNVGCRRPNMFLDVVIRQYSS